MSYMNYPSTLMLIKVSCLKKYGKFGDFKLYFAPDIDKNGICIHIPD
jgi:hypothetical protein